MDFKKQISNLEIETVLKPRVYLKWNNSEIGRDKKSCFERIDGSFIGYINIYNKSKLILQGNKFFPILEELYYDTLKKY